MPAPHDPIERSAGTPEERLTDLRARLRQLESVVVCYSGGIDSTLVLAVAHEQLGANAVALTAVSPSLAPSEKEGAAVGARRIGVRHHFIASGEIERPEYVRNGPDRCFHCKTELYTLAEHHRELWGLRHIINGTNRDDLADVRPGLEAARRAGVLSPLVELGFSKADVRAVARLLRLEDWDKPASACLASRIPYGTSVTPERLGQIARIEARLRSLGLHQVRARWHGEMVRIEVPAADIPRLCAPDLRAELVAAGKDCGFAYVTLDLEGYRQGSHNEVLRGRALPLVEAPTTSPL